MSSLLGLAANGTIALAFVAIAAIVFHGLWKTNQLTSNPLALATGAIFFSGGIGHGLRAYLAATSNQALPFEAAIWAWDGVTAAIAVVYLTLRKRFPSMLRGTAMVEDMLQRQKDAVQINDTLVQDLTEAKLALELGEERQGREALERSLASAKTIMSDLLGRVDGANGPPAGTLRRNDRPGVHA